MDLNLPEVWKDAVARVAALGALHAMMNQKPLRENQLLSTLLTPGVVIYSRRFHSRLLRSAYGAGYNGVKLVAEAKAKGY